MPLSDYNGQDSFTIGGNSFINRASSGTPIYERTGGGDGGSGGTEIASFDFQIASNKVGTPNQNGTALSVINDTSYGKDIDASKTYYLIGSEGIMFDEQKYQYGESNYWTSPDKVLHPKNVRVPVITDGTKKIFYHSQSPSARSSGELVERAAQIFNRAASTGSVGNFDGVWLFIYEGKMYAASSGFSNYGPLRLHFLVVGGSGSSSGGSSGGILDMEKVAINTQTPVEYDASTGRILEMQQNNGHAYINLADFTVLKSYGNSNSLLASPSNSNTQIDGTYREIMDNISVRTVAEGKLQFVGSSNYFFAIRHA